MKKSIWVIAAILTLLVSLSIVGFAFAQTVTPNNPENGQGWGPGRGMMGRGMGMMGGRWNGGTGYGPMHEYMIAAFAEALGMTEEDLEAELDTGKTMWQVAEEKGFTQEEFGDLMVTARTNALNKAVEDGVITREQADWMIARMAQMQANGYGPGNCPMHGGGGFVRRTTTFGWQWNQ